MGACYGTGDADAPLYVRISRYQTIDEPLRQDHARDLFNVTFYEDGSCRRAIDSHVVKTTTCYIRNDVCLHQSFCIITDALLT